MEEKEKLHVSVRELVEFVFREGDIDNRGGQLRTADAMAEGAKLHRQIQKAMGPEYQSEVPLSATLERPLYLLMVEGRADGIFTAKGLPGDNEEPEGQLSLPLETPMDTGSRFLRTPGQRTLDATEDRTTNTDGFVPESAHGGQRPGLEPEDSGENGQKPEDVTGPGEELVWIDEIKGTYRRLETLAFPDYVHIAQAMCYACIFARQNRLRRIGVRMTYCHMEPHRTKGYAYGRDTRQRRYFHAVFTMEQLDGWYGALMEEYCRWADFRVKWHRLSRDTLRRLDFPYTYRAGQKQLAGDVYRTISRRKILFLQAPTGVGKTICTVFPAVKALGEGLAERIFYLTAKTVTATVARQTLGLLQERGGRMKVIMLTAKEKLCLCSEKLACDPGHCAFARGHFDRVNEAVFSLLTGRDTFTREEILAQAREYRVCPYELSLDLALFADAIVCDYNYVFDPDAELKRFFQEGAEGGENIFLVDEAHNLVDRSRQMYSARLMKEELLEVKGILRGKSPALTKLLDRCNRGMLQIKRDCGQEYRILENGIGELYFSLFLLREELEEFLQYPEEFPDRGRVLDFYFALRSFLNIYDLVDEHYRVYARHFDEKSFGVCLFCVDPSANLQRRLDRSRACVFFSATLLPVRYYKDLLSEKKDNYAIYADSPFDGDKRLILLGGGVSTRYKRRDSREFQRMAAYIDKAISCKCGNYMVFFPSYRLMEQVHEAFLALERPVACETAVQTPGMEEGERERFLALFDKRRDHSFAAFCVMGGIFGEGIDLKNDRLIGSIVVGTGLPQISREREILRDYYQQRSGNGFDYAFRYPGMNKVLQAAGRVIRTMEDEGIILLLDDRFLERDYQPLFPREWRNRQTCSLSDVEEKIRNFWSRRK